MDFSTQMLLIQGRYLISVLYVYFPYNKIAISISLLDKIVLVQVRELSVVNGVGHVFDRSVAFKQKMSD